MNMKTLALLFALCLLWGDTTFGEEQNIWGKMKNRLETLAPQKKMATTTAVGGVRGAKEQTSDSLYWKNESKKEAIDEVEYTRFNEAYQAATSGQTEDAAARFEAFLKDFPQSTLKPEAEEALAALRKKP